MTKYYYDLHIHSCLSPCAEDDMTPNNIAGMGVLAGLNVMALTDHNSAKNCPAFYKAAAKNGIIPIAGMELTTAEDIHAVCLFETLEGALEFDRLVDGRRLKVPNNVNVFGAQTVLDENDEPIGQEPFYLHPAADISIEETPKLVSAYGGVCFPAHVDREANGIIATLGTFPAIQGVNNAEFYDAAKQPEYLERYPVLKEMRLLVSSDAHNLWSIRDRSAYFTLDAPPEAPDEVRREIFTLLRGRL
jgi:hypothetical protein